jgi:hypothetical protein
MRNKQKPVYRQTRQTAHLMLLPLVPRRSPLQGKLADAADPHFGTRLAARRPLWSSPPFAYPEQPPTSSTNTYQPEASVRVKATSRHDQHRPVVASGDPEVAGSHPAPPLPVRAGPASTEAGPASCSEVAEVIPLGYTGRPRVVGEPSQLVGDRGVAARTREQLGDHVAA